MPEFEVGDRVKYSDEWLKACAYDGRRARYAAMSGEVIRVKGDSVMVKWLTLKTPGSLYIGWLALDECTDCPVCYGPCEPEIHAATLRVQAWFREFVAMGLDKVVVPGKRFQAVEEGVGV